MTHPGVSLDFTLRLVAQEVESAGLRDVIAAIGVGGKAGGVVCHGVNGAAMELLNLSDVATDCVLAFEPVAFEAGKPLEERIAADITVVGDADRLRRLISILLDNAVKYGAEGGHITLTLEKTDRQARLTVSNPGDPIPPEHLAHLFERFYRADASRGEKSGFGLGLAIADTIAREHKGALKAESDAASTRFTFTIPLRKQA